MLEEPISTQEEIVPLAVGSLEPQAYAYGIQKEINDQANLKWSLGTIHTILYRLENKGLLKSSLGGASEKRGGRSKRLYSLTAKGYGNVQSIQETRQAMWNKLVTNKPSI